MKTPAEITPSIVMVVLLVFALAGWAVCMSDLRWSPIHDDPAPHLSTSGGEQLDLDVTSEFAQYTRPHVAVVDCIHVWLWRCGILDGPPMSYIEDLILSTITPDPWDEIVVTDPSSNEDQPDSRILE